MKVKVNSVEYETPVYFKKHDTNCSEYYAYIGSRVIVITLFDGNEYAFNYDMYKIQNTPRFKPEHQITEQDFVAAYKRMVERFPRFLGMNKIDGITQ